MSYDLELGVKTENGNFVLTRIQPEYANPTYNLGRIFRNLFLEGDKTDKRDGR